MAKHRREKILRESQAKMMKMVGLGVDANPMTNLHIRKPKTICTKIINLSEKGVVSRAMSTAKVHSQVNAQPQSYQISAAPRKQIAVTPKPLLQPKATSQRQSYHATVAPPKHVAMKPTTLSQPWASSQTQSSQAIIAHKHLALKRKALSQPQANSKAQSSQATIAQKHLGLKRKAPSQSQASSQSQSSRATFPPQKHVAIKSKPLSQPQAQSSQATTTPLKPIAVRPYIRKSTRILNQVKAQPTRPPETIIFD
ncbi:hypothetical protein EUGRSUZ_H05151 [Eucalyptus grandis]|uniref:Uncharacterized protein n=2 Tax=Eucalyptus grandis TaxID=71139 RepID=A0A059BA24_EUCGR|nr:hypothetical protein EUGRSUZ_H05151 [Eucalyptus grandis]